MGNKTNDVPFHRAKTGDRPIETSENGVMAVDRQAREAAELRRNLQRRKTQQRSRRDLSS